MVMSMAKEHWIKFVGWLDKDKKIAIVEYGGRKYYIPRTRLIPHPVCQLRHLDIRDPNKLAIICAEENSFLGIPVFRHILHLDKLGNPKLIEPQKVYDFPKTVKFSCVRDKILKEKMDTDKAIKVCSV